MKPKKAHMIVIGLDGVSYPLLQQWTGAGFLPNIAGLMNNGICGQHRTVPNMNSAPAWTSFATGCNPGKHGIFYFYERLPQSYLIRYLNGRDCATRRFWSYLSHGGMKVGIVNVPMTFPAEEVNGFMIAGLDAPSTSSKGFCHPAGVFKEIRNRGLHYVIEPGITGYVAAGNPGEAITKGFEAIEARTATVRYLQEKYSCDVLVVVYRMADVMQHYFWHFQDPTHPRFDEPGGGEYRDAILKTYQKLDQAVGALVAMGGKDTVYCLVSDHGAGAAEGGVGLLRDFLIAIGCLKTQKNSGNGGMSRITASARGRLKRVVGHAYHFVCRHTSRRTKERLLHLVPALRDRVEGSIQFADIDWKGTRAYCARDRTEIWINTRGREPLGTVDPGAEYGQVCAYIAEKLVQWRNPGTGEAVVAKVETKENLYHGPFAMHAPDILVTWRDGVHVKGIAFEEPDGSLRQFPTGEPGHHLVTGKHIDNGFFLLHGPPITRGVEMTGARIEDIAPTLLYLAGQPVPEHMDGKVLTEALEKEFLEKNPVRFDDGNTGTPGSPGHHSDYTQDETSIIEERLRNLGYIE
jgi:predicted AlkP superfamily phosphohydrolase/phosphomutase